MIGLNTVGGFELKSDRISVTMLGSGCWEGTPAPFCRCKLCRIASKNILSIENRMRPSFYIKSKKVAVCHGAWTRFSHADC